MESFPSEFTGHHLPLCFVAGLDPPPAPAPAAAPTVSPDGRRSPPSAAPPAASSSDPFVILTASLRKTMASRKGFPLWDNSRGANNDFHIVLVDKNVRFPPLKARPSSTAQQPPAALHSPISPLTPTSPLYPDGIIAPIWIRKHRELVPSVFILVLRLFESRHSGGPPLDPLQREEVEREKDSELVQEIINRKRSTVERGIKLAVVLLCSRDLLDDPSLDLRLSLIRRQSGLDSRASLFVISPVPQSEVNNFVMSIRAELYPAALDYYREHGRRVRRKRARQVPKGGLSDRGWNVRYDYKLGLFSEMRGEMEVSLKHYEDCYDTLIDMFAQPDLLVPRTKRWAEGKVLADCLTVKIAKMYLYLNEPSRALAQLNRHVFRFRELSESWQIGEQTFEFWSWLSKQYRLFGDLVSVALRAGFHLPSLRPPPTPRPAPSGMAQPPSPVLVPLNVLQHPGHYYYLSAVCAVERRERFRAIQQAMELEQDGLGVTPATPALAHEAKVDHAEVIIELLTKAYEFFKAHKTKNMTFFIAAQIARAHFEGGNHEMALKFHDRIAKNYRRDRWRDILDSILELSFRSAVKIGDYPSAIRAGFELLSPESSIAVDQRAQYAEKLMGILTTNSPASPDNALINLESDLAPLFICRVAFWRPSTTICHPIPFQLSLSAPTTSRSSAFTFFALEIYFSDDRPPIGIVHADASPSSSAVIERYGLGPVGEKKERTALLRWEDGVTKVFTGAVTVDKEVNLTIVKVVLTGTFGAWTVALDLKPDSNLSLPAPVWYAGQKAIPLLHLNPSFCVVSPREVDLRVDISHKAPAYLGEAFPIDVEVTNDDEIELEVFLVLFLQPAEDGTQNRILVDDQASTAVIESLSLGLLAPNTSLRKTLFLESLGLPGDRQLDVTLRAQPSPSSTSSLSVIPSSTEITRSLSIPAVRPVLAAFDTQMYRRRRAVKPLLDLTEPDGWEGASDATLMAKLQAAGPWDIEVTGIRIACGNSPSIRVTESSLDDLDGPLSMTWTPTDLFSAIFRLDVQPLLHEQQQPAEGAYLELTWRRAGTSDRPTVTSVALPSLNPLPLLPRVSLRVPPFLVLHQPVTLTYRFSNPTPRLLTLSTHIDSAEHASSFVFAGLRKIPSFFLAPDEEREVRVTVVPLVVGQWALPKLRAFEVEQVQQPQPRHPGEIVEQDRKPLPQVLQTKLRELEVVVETDAIEEKDPAQVGLEADLRSARDEDDGGELSGGAAARAPVVLVLPR
ncbi:hypothetical protein JCM1841_003742 [Sporobolomyces salmonicolor]